MNYRLRQVRDFFKYDIPQGFGQFAYWYKIIWKNRWYDSGFLLQLMEHQIKLMEKNWVVNTNHVGDEEIKEKMQETLKSLNRLITEEYHTCEAHNEKWGHAEMITTPVEGKNYFSVDFKRKNVKTEEDEEQERKEYKNLMDREAEMIEADVEIVFENLKDCGKWWD